MYLFIAVVALLGFVSAAQAQDRRFSALAEFASGAHEDPAPAPAANPPSHEDSSGTDGFSGAFSARQTAKNLGY